MKETDLKDKTLLIISFTYCTFVKDLTDALASYFKEVYVLVRRNPLYEVAGLIPLPYFKSRKLFTIRYTIDLTNKPGNLHAIPTTMWNLPFEASEKLLDKKQFLAATKAIRKFNIKFDMVHAHFGWPSGYAAVELSKKYGKPCVITAHGYDVYDYPFRNKYWEGKYQSIYNEADEVITVSRRNADCLKQLGIKKEAHIIPNGFSQKLFHYKQSPDCRKKLKLPSEKKIILTIGAFVREKGYDTLLKTLALISRQRQDFLCLHIGAGPLQESVLRKSEELFLAPFIRFLGSKPHYELVDWFGACDFFVSSSIAEGNPTVLFESLGCGKAFIGTKVGGVPDIVTSDDYGLLAEPGDVNTLANNIIAALDKKWDPEKILRYSEQFTWDKIAEQYAAIFAGILARSTVS